MDYSPMSLQNDHMEWWADLFQFSSNTTCLFWVYNQTVPVWPIVLCLINEKHMKDFAFLALLAFPHGPFPFVGIFIFCIMKAILLIFKAQKEKTLAKEIQLMLSPQNFISSFSILPVFALYFTSNGVVSGASGEAMGGEVNTRFRLLSVFDTIKKQEDSFEKTRLTLDFIRRYALFVFFGSWGICSLF